MTRRLAALSLGLATALAFPPSMASADEAWANATATAFWDVDVPGFAVFNLTTGNQKVQRVKLLFVAGLAGGDQRRGTYGGYWSSVDPTAQLCPVPIIDALGNEAWSWGRLDLTFNVPGFPSGWQAALGLCFEPAVEFVAVEPVTGNAPVPAGK